MRQGEHVTATIRSGRGGGAGARAIEGHGGWLGMAHVDKADHHSELRRLSNERERIEQRLIDRHLSQKPMDTGSENMARLRIKRIESEMAYTDEEEPYEMV